MVTRWRGSPLRLTGSLITADKKFRDRACSIDKRVSLLVGCEGNRPVSAGLEWDWMTSLIRPRQRTTKSQT